MPALRRIESLFSHSAGVLLLALATGLILSNLANLGFTQPHDLILGVRMQYLFWIVGGVATAIAVVCLRDAKSLTKLTLVFWLALNFTVYQAFVLVDGGTSGLKGYLGSPAQAFGISTSGVEWILRVSSLYLLVGSSALLAWLWLAKRAYLKISCAHCGGHIEFHKSGLGRRIECPHCRASIILALPERAAPDPGTPRTRKA